MKEQFAVTVIVQYFLKFFSFVVSYIKLQILTVSSFASIAFAFTWCAFFTFFLDLGMDISFFYYYDREDKNETYSSYLVIKLILLACNYALPFILLLSLNFDPLLRTLIFITLVSSIFENITLIFIRKLQRDLKIIRIEIVNLVFGVFLNVLTLLVLYNITLLENPLVWLVLINIIKAVPNTVVVGIMVFRTFHPKNPSKKLIKDYFVYAKPFIIQIIISILANQIGGFLLGLTNIEDLAYYYVVENLFIQVLLLAAGAPAPIFASKFATYFSENNYEAIQELSNRWERFSSMIFFGLTVIFIISADLIFEIVLPKYIQSAIYLQLLVFLPYIASIGLPYSQYLTYSGHLKISANLANVINILFLVLQILVIPNNIGQISLLGLGAIGLCVIRIFVTVLSFALYIFYAKKLFNIKASLFHDFIHIILGVIALLIGFALRIFMFSKIFDNLLIVLVLSAGSVAGIYFFALIITKEFRKSDLDLIKSLMRPSSYFRAYRDEQGETETPETQN